MEFSDSNPSICTHQGQRLACLLSLRPHGLQRYTPTRPGGPWSEAAGAENHWVLWSTMCDALNQPTKSTETIHI